jgi:hypothetical protein
VEESETSKTKNPALPNDFIGYPQENTKFGFVVVNLINKFILSCNQFNKINSFF